MCLLKRADKQVCVSLYDWQTFPEQWAKSKHPDEKALYKVLTEDVGPQIIEVLQVGTESWSPELTIGQGSRAHQAGGNQ